MQNKVIEIRLNVYVPINDKICIDSVDQDHVYEIKFHGKPVNILPLTNSNKEKIKEKNKIEEIFFSKNGPTIKIAKPKNKDKNRGTSMSEKGIKFLNSSSCVKDIAIQ